MCPTGLTVSSLTFVSGFFSLPETGLETALLAGRPHRGMDHRERLWKTMSGWPGWISWTRRFVSPRSRERPGIPDAAPSLSLAGHVEKVPPRSGFLVGGPKLN